MGSRLRRHSLELARRVELPERQIFEHPVRGREVRDIEDECDAPAVLQRVPLVDFAIQVESNGFPRFVGQEWQAPWPDRHRD